jgi:putative hydrolase of the HAD superfamily
VPAALAALASRWPLVCLTDGNPRIQNAKLDALGLRDYFTEVVITDELGGRATRKPAPDGLLAAGECLGVQPSELVMVGDRPVKDTAIARAVGARCVRVLTGEYRAAVDEPAADLVAADLPTAARVLLAL